MLGGSLSGQTAQAKFEAFLSRMGEAVAIAGLGATPLSTLRATVAFIVGPGAPSQAALAAGCDAHVSKPFTKQQLFDILGKYVRISPAPRKTS